MREKASTTALLRELQESSLVIRESLRSCLWAMEDALSATTRIDAAIARLADAGTNDDDDRPAPDVAPVVRERRRVYDRAEVSR